MADFLKIGKDIIWRICQVHPTYVYSARFHPRSARVLVTAGFDRVVRVWVAETAEGGYGVQQELTGHNSHINCLAFDMEGQFLFSGDKSGNIRMWETPEMFDPESSTGSSGPPAVSLRRGRSWDLKKEYSVAGAGSGGGPVARLAVHPGGRRLLVHTVHPAAPLVMLDLRTGSVMQTYPDLQTFRLPAASCVTPCGSWVLAGSSCGAAILWNTDTGAKRHVYKVGSKIRKIVK